MTRSLRGLQNTHFNYFFLLQRKTVTLFRKKKNYSETKNMFSRSQALTSKHFFTLINPGENGLVFSYKGQGCDIMGAAGMLAGRQDGRLETGNGKSKGPNAGPGEGSPLPWVPWPHCHGHKNVQSILYAATFAHTLSKLIISESQENGFSAESPEKSLMETIFLLSGLLDFTFYSLLGQLFHICFYCTQVGA